MERMLPSVLNLWSRVGQLSRLGLGLPAFFQPAVPAEVRLEVVYVVLTQMFEQLVVQLSSEVV